MILLRPPPSRKVATRGAGHGKCKPGAGCQKVSYSVNNPSPILTINGDSESLFIFDARVITPSLDAIEKAHGVTSGDFRSVSLAGQDLSGLNLTLGDFTRGDFTATTFTGAALVGATFVECDLSRATFSSSAAFGDELYRGLFERVTFNANQFKNWSYLTLKEVKINGTDLTGLQATETKAVGINLTGRNLSNAVFHHADLTGADLTRTTVTKTKFQGATTLSHANFQGANGNETCFEGQTLDYVDFSPDKGVPTCLRGASFNDATLTPGVDLSQADLSPVNPDDLTTASQFHGAKMNGVALSMANLTGAVFTGVELHDANLSNSTLSGADLTGAQLGEFSELFRVGSTSPDYNPFLSALQTLSAKGVIVYFKTNHHPISPDRDVRRESSAGAFLDRDRQHLADPISRAQVQHQGRKHELDRRKPGEGRLVGGRLYAERQVRWRQSARRRRVRHPDVPHRQH